MAGIKINWTGLLNLTELDFEPTPPQLLQLSDEIALSLAILTAATGHDRKLVRCNELGALLTGNVWDNLAVVENDQLFINTGTPDSFTATVANKGVLLATVDVIIQASFVRISGGATEIIYIAANSFYFYPHTTYSVSVDGVPIAGNVTTYVGLSAFN